MSSLVGKSLGRYQVIEQLGSGGMATVYKAYDTRLERYVAIKVIRADQTQAEAFLKRFEREAKTLARLSHPNIVKVLDYGDYEGAPYLVMEFISGGTLKAKATAMPWAQAARLLAPMARALEYVHQHNIIHRDVKPSNFLVTDAGIPMLSDFGIAKILQAEDVSHLTGTGVGIGTPAYMAPEQGSGKTVDERADIYSLGIVFYELLTGRTPYRADTPLAVLLMHMNDPLPPPRNFVPDLPEAVEKVLLKALAKAPEHRFQTMGHFAQALESLAASSDAAALSIQDLNTLELERGSAGAVTSPPLAERRALPIGGALSKRKTLIVLAILCSVVVLGCLLLWAAYVLNICLPAGPYPSPPWCGVDIPPTYNRLICPPPGPWLLPPWCSL